ncbi:coiled-coil domain-containing protein 22 homolog isoform X2 [Tachypleus tridentatus]|uniref:coiled-coil domain-containing protein 22 homolog isoform X2 n=1 Tax=Tachypleus tridentatus TaxID=6853 RepID=UPI003FD13E3B
MELGYKGEIGYQTFLYSNDSELRKIFIFLIEKLPKEAEKVTDEPLGKSDLLNRAIAEELSRQLKLPWLPNYCKPNGLRWSSPNQVHREGCRGAYALHTCNLFVPRDIIDSNSKVVQVLEEYYEKELPFVSQQVCEFQDLAPSVLEMNDIVLTANIEWENEWNQSGLPSRLSEEEYKQRKKERIQKKIAEHIKKSYQNSKGPERGSHSLAEFHQLLSSMSEKREITGVIKGSRFVRAEKLQFAQDEKNIEAPVAGPALKKPDTEEDLKSRREEELKTLQSELDDLSHQLEQLELQMKQYNASLQQIGEQILSEETKNKELEETYKLRKRTFDLLPDADNNLKKLQEVVETSGQRLVALAGQWEKHRAPLIEQYRHMKELSSQRLSETQRKLEEIKSLREKMKDCADEARSKEDLYKQLLAEYERLAKDVNRSAYTRRIIEILANIKKQREEIDKVLIDTKAIQKEINQLSGKLDRTFTVTDELIFRDAKKDEAVRKAYKYLAALHENCSSLIQTVEETGTIVREIRDLEDQIEQESQKKVADNLERITADYKQMKQENSSLMTQLKV